MKIHEGNSSLTLYLAVVPEYRSECINLLREMLGDRLHLFASQAHLDPSVKTGIPRDSYSEVGILRVGRSFFLQYGHWRDAFRAASLIVDLNPRSITSWLLLISRRLFSRRTLAWGHINPQAGESSRTAPLRRTMRRISSGAIAYTYRDAESALRSFPDSEVWVAPNSLYRRSALGLSEQRTASRTDLLYVGRLEPKKKVDLLVRGFADASSDPQFTGRLSIVGDGSERAYLETLVDELGLGDRVTFHGWVSEFARLRELYGRAFAAASPGFAGLGLTQSLGFGVPVVVAEGEPHSPEIELEESGGLVWFAHGSSSALAKQVVDMWNGRELLPNHDLVQFVADRYSAEAMAQGLADALSGKER